jgi:hypothetical protein
MPEPKFDKQEIWVICAFCGRQRRNHRVLHKEQRHFLDEPGGFEVSREYHRLVECKGCEIVKYVISTLDLQSYDEYEGPEESKFIVYPDAPGTAVGCRAAINKEDTMDDSGDDLIPETVWKMYRETVEALNANIRTLAGGGLRAVVEAICLDKKITAGNLQTKIEELAKEGLLTKSLFHKGVSAIE